MSFDEVYSYGEMMIVSYFVVDSRVDEVGELMYKTVEAGIGRKVNVLTDDDMRKCTVWVE